MRLRHALRPALAIGLLALPALALVAQQRPETPARNASQESPANPQLDLPYGAASADAVSPWTPPASAGRQLTLRDLLGWKSIRSPQLSNDGRWMAYELAPNEGDSEVIIRSTAASGQEWRFPVGAAPSGSFGSVSLGISGNNRWVAFLVRPNADAARARPRSGGNGTAGGGASSAPANKLAIVNLADGSKREYENVRSYTFAGDTSSWIAIQHAPAAGGGNGAAASGSLVQLVNLAADPTAPSIPIPNVTEYAFDDAGQWMAYAIATPDRLGNSLQLRRLANGETRALDTRKATYRRITWADSSLALAAVRVESDSTESVDEIVSVLAWSRVTANDAPRVVDGKTSGLPAGKVLSDDYSIAFSRGAGALYVGLRDPRPPAPRASGGNAGGGSSSPAPGAGSGGRQAAAPQTDPDVPSLVLWHWKDTRVQSQQQVQENNDRNFVHVAAYRMAANALVPLTDDSLKNLARGPRDTWGVAAVTAPYELDASIRGYSYRDMYAVNLQTGERKLIQAKVPGGGFFGGGNAFSPDNSKIAYYDTGDWKVYDFASGQVRVLTQGVDNAFWDDEDDHNQVKPQVGGAFMGWTRDNGSILVRDNYDIWRLPLSGTARNLTGNGRSTSLRYLGRVSWDSRDRGGIDPAQPMFVETYGEYTKREGLVQIDVARGGVRVISDEDAKVDYRRARDANVWAFTRQSATTYPDWYVADAGLANPRRITTANPQQAEVAWTPGARLIEYKCENSDERRQAALFLPAGYEQGKQYPMLTYIYELLSQNYNVYQQPNATRYANASVYTSRGYAYLMPDITYHLDDPGRSALWCVVPAVKAAIATGMIDTARVGLQGHSWGGYQTTFITTQTNIFKTAVAGAPLTDMVSMFGSIYWNTGSTDGSIFIASQGRFTGGPNERPEAYMRNSPQVFAHQLSIPFMILHNDRDGAVDFNQGITYYNHLRQLGKEVVLLEYVGENHGLSRPANQKDYALRMTEWFDTFLRDQPAPDWLTQGVPRLKMESHLKTRRPMVDAKAEVPRVVP
jgi:dipeptidyl aminopeptidase/acylaminoacyl peptidase